VVAVILDGQGSIEAGKPFSIAVLGPMMIAGREGLQLRDRTVLGVLLMSAGSLVTTDEIGFALWGDELPTSYRKIVQGGVARLRRELGSGAIRTADNGYRLAVNADAVDANVFEQQVALAVENLAAGHAARAMRILRESLGLWRGRPLAELDHWPPAEAEARRLEELREHAIDVLLEAELLAGYHAVAAADARRLVDEAPYRERRWVIWARALYVEGRQAEALDVLARLRKVLREELGVDPGPSVVTVEQAILQHDSALAVATAIPTGSQCPWPGLLPYDVDDAATFFGRADAIEACCARLRASRRLIVVGRSGIGKSSLVRAGLLPSLARSMVITPGPHPVAALAHVPEEATLVVDQTEEAVTQCVDVEERREFFHLLDRRVGPVVLVVRADLLDELAVFAGFARMLEVGVFVLRPLDEEGLRAAVEGPADHASVRLEPGLVELLLEECRGQPGCLPMLSHALAETWQRAEGNMLTVAGYRQSGGIRGAIAQTAEQVYESLGDDQRRRVRALFRRLVRYEGDEPVRTRTARPAGDSDVVERLLSARLLTAAEDHQLQIAHEELARCWPRLVEWAAEDRDGDRLLGHLAGEAREWQRMGRPSGLLYRGVRLDAAVSWAADHSDDIALVERQFLAASHDESQLALRRERRANRRLRAALAVAGVLLAVSVAGTLFAGQQRRTADRARDAAQIARDYSEALRIGGLAEAAHSPSVAFGLVAESLRVDDSPAARAAALEVFGRFRGLISSDSALGTPHQPTAEAAVSSDGTLRAEADDHTVRLIDTATGTIAGQIEGLPTTPNALAFDASGRHLAGGYSELGFADTGTTVVWDVGQSIEIARFDSGDGAVWSHRFSADGSSVFSYGDDGVHEWDLTGLRSLARTAKGAPTMFRAGDLSLSMWDDSVEAWIIEACALAGRSLTPEEWRADIGDREYRPVC
jgi:DNA-binding SARP family transcriptional activator